MARADTSLPESSRTCRKYPIPSLGVSGGVEKLLVRKVGKGEGVELEKPPVHAVVF
jgi:hypothetical protein